MRTLIPLLLAFGAASGANAQAIFTLQPTQTRQGETVILRMDDASGCVPAPQIDVQRLAGAVTVEVNLTDAGPCLPEWATPRPIPLGTFAPGVYEVRAYLCGNSPPPAPACELQATLQLSVSARPRFTVPALSGAFAIGLTFLTMAAAALTLRDR